MARLTATAWGLQSRLPDGWWAKAACRDRYTFTDKDIVVSPRKAARHLAICDSCPVLAQCYADIEQDLKAGRPAPKEQVRAGRIWAIDGRLIAVARCPRCRRLGMAHRLCPCITAERMAGRKQAIAARSAAAAARARIEGLHPDDPRHGSYLGYNRYGCRCRLCTDAMLRQKQAERRFRANLRNQLRPGAAPGLEPAPS